MISLLNPEVDVVPGRRPQQQALGEGMVGMGAAVLRVTNTTERENAYLIRLECQEPYWQDGWLRFSAMPPAPGQSAPPASKPDQLGPKDSWIKIYVSHGGVRDVLISFFVPQKPECRAGVYPVTVVVETQVLDGQAQSPAQGRFTEIKGVVIVRPFYDWTLEFQPPERRVGLFRRKTAFEVLVHNRGNDWLYCDLKLGKMQQALASVDVLRLAVPPPEPGKESFRSIPLRAHSKRRNIRGKPQPDEIPLTLQRVDAPSVPPLPELALSTVCGAGLGNPVIHSETNEAAAPETPPTVVYCPPIPATLTEFIQALARNAMAISMLFIGLVVMFHMAALGWYWLIKKIADFEPLNTEIAAGQPIRVKGSGIIGDIVIFADPKSGKEIERRIVKPDPQRASFDRGLVPTKDIPDGEYQLLAQRSTILEHLTAIMPRYQGTRRWVVRIGTVVKPIKFIPPDSVKGGDKVLIPCPGIANQVKVYFGNRQAKVTPKGNDAVLVEVPADLAEGAATMRVVQVTPSGEEIVSESKLSVVSQEVQVEPLVVRFPPTIEIGKTFKVSGSGFTPDMQILANGAPLTVSVNSETSAEVAGTENLQPGPVTLEAYSMGGEARGAATATGGRKAPPPPPPPPPTGIPGYDELVQALSTRDYDPVIAAYNRQRDHANPAAQAVQAFALAASGDVQRAKRALAEARTALRAVSDRAAKLKAEAIIRAADARIGDTPRTDPREALPKYSEAYRFATENDAGAFAALALVEFLIRRGDSQTALGVLERAEGSITMSRVEKQTALELRNAAGG